MFLTSYADIHQVAKATPYRAAENLHQLFSKQPLEDLDAGHPLFWEGDEAKHVFEVVEGAFRLFRITPDGHRVITGFLYAGDLIGLSLKDDYLYSAEAITAVRVRRLARKIFDDEVAESEDLGSELFCMMCNEMAVVQDHMVLLSSKTAEERLCTFLVRHLQRGRNRGGATIELPMTRQDIADHLGLTIETVSRNITKLIAKGVVKVANPAARHFISVEKPALLAQLAGDGDECLGIERQADRDHHLRH